MKQFFTLIIAALITSSLFAQQDTSYNGNGNTSPVVQGAVAAGVLTLSDDGNYLTLTFAKGTAPLTKELVIYVDSYGNGISSTQNLTDTSNLLKAGISANRGAGFHPVINFDPSFTPQYAIAFNPRPRGGVVGSVVKLVENGRFITQANISILNGNDTNALTYQTKIKLKSIGITTTTPVNFSFFVTTVDPLTNERYSEAVGDPMTGFVDGFGDYTATAPPFDYSGSALSSDASALDSLALVELYDSTRGASWTNNTNWLTAAPISTWYGVTVANNRVNKIELSNNNLTGVLPYAINDFDSIDVFNVADNAITGRIPTWINGMANLSSINVSHNQFIGKIPKLDSLKKLVTADFGNNQLTLIAPQSLPNLVVLKEFRADSNSITGTIPSELGKILSLDVLDLSHNQFSGTVPPQIGSLSNLTQLDLSNNQLSGSIPSSFGGLTSVKRLILDSNQFSGSIPKQFVSLTALTDLYLNANQLSGSIPVQLSKLTQLDTLYLQLNNLSDTIPASLSKLTKLEFLNIRKNNLTGNIPESFKNLTSLRALNVSYNSLSGTYPSLLVTLPNLTKISTKYNNYTFAGLEPVVQHGFDTLIYGPQQRIDITNNGGLLSVSVGGTPANNTYQWYRNNALVATINADSTYQPVSDGNYYVIVTNSICEDLTLMSNVLPVALGGIKSNNTSAIEASKPAFSVFPNPAQSNVTLSFSLTGKCVIKVTNLYGAVLQTKTVTGAIQHNTIPLDVSNYAAGMYFITITNDKNETKTITLNKQ